MAVGLDFLLAGGAAADEAKVRIVFFTPKDVQPPAKVAERMRQVVDYGQDFYGKWLRHWGYEPENVLPIDHDSNGFPKIHFVKGAETAASGKYNKVGYQWAVREQAIAEHGIPRAGSTWWIFVYGTKLRASRGLGGFADVKGNGWALLVWHDVPGRLLNDTALSGGVAEQINLKGYLHELGHTMNLAHFGPLDRMVRAGEGRSLMGPNARTYRKSRKNREAKVHLTEATAALIWKHPQMTGRFNARIRPPRIQLTGLKTTYDARAKYFKISGHLKASVGAHSVVAIDMPGKGPSGYWKKAHSSRLNRDGRFELVVDELAPSGGILKVVFGFDNGYITGTGKGYGYKFAVDVPYQYERNRHHIGAGVR